MDTFETIKQFLSEGGKCLLVENGKPIGVVLTVEEYEKLKNKPESPAFAEEINSEPIVNPANSIGEAILKEADFSEGSADLADINLADAGDITLEDLGLDELPY